MIHKPSSNGLTPATITEALNLEQIAVAGHSFGGGTSLGLALRQAEQRAERGISNDLPQVKAAILFDGWMYPLRGSEGPAFDKTIAASTFDSSVPTLFINAEMWKGSENYFRYSLPPICSSPFFLTCPSVLG